VWRLLVALCLGTLALLLFSLILGVGFHLSDANPTRWIHGGQYVAAVAAWATVIMFVWRHRARSRQGARVDQQPLHWLDFGIVLFRLALLAALHVTVSLCLGGSIVWLGFGTAVVLALVTLPPLLAFDVWLARRPPPIEAPVDRRQGMHAPSALVVVIASAIGVWLVEPRVSRDSLLSVPLWPYRLARHTLNTYAAPVATDECLARNVVHYGASASHQTGTGSGLGSDIAVYIETAPARSANHVLAKRRETAVPGTARVLADVLESGTREEQLAAVDLLKRVAYRGGIQPVLVAWAESPTHPVGQGEAQRWLACLRKGRRDYIHKDVFNDGINQACELPPPDKRSTRAPGRP
jgi:hypothetical protein